MSSPNGSQRERVAARAAGDLLVGRDLRLDQRPRVVMLSNVPSPGRAHRGQELGVTREMHDPLGERAPVTFCDEEAVDAVGHLLGQPAVARRDDWEPACERLGDNGVHGLLHVSVCGGLRRLDEHMLTAEEVDHVLDREISLERGRVAEAQRGVQVAKLLLERAAADDRAANRPWRVVLSGGKCPQADRLRPSSRRSDRQRQAAAARLAPAPARGTDSSRRRC